VSWHHQCIKMKVTLAIDRRASMSSSLDRALDSSGLYYKHTTIINDDRNRCQCLECHFRGIISDHNIYIESPILIVNYNCNTLKVQATVSTIVNCDHNMFIVQATISMIVNYNCNTSKVQATVSTIVNCYLKMFIVQATVCTIINYDRKCL
jgi:hypothetical protein